MRKDFHAKAQSREELNDIAAILLAAGRSRRMGAFKPLLPFGDKTVIEQCIANLTGAGIQNITVVVGHRADEIREQLKDCEITFALNPDSDSEMSISIARGVEQVDEQAKAIVIALVDHPAIAPAVIRLLIDEWRNGHGKLFQPEYEGRGGHPVLIDLAYRDELLSLDPQLIRPAEVEQLLLRQSAGRVGGAVHQEGRREDEEDLATSPYERQTTTEGGPGRRPARGLYPRSRARDAPRDRGRCRSARLYALDAA